MTELHDSRSLLSISMYNIIMVYNLGVSLSSSRSWRTGTRCESHRKEGLLSTPTNQKKTWEVRCERRDRGGGVIIVDWDRPGKLGVREGTGGGGYHSGLG